MIVGSNTENKMHPGRIKQRSLVPFVCGSRTYAIRIVHDATSKHTLSIAINTPNLCTTVIIYLI